MYNQDITWESRNVQCATKDRVLVHSCVAAVNRIGGCTPSVVGTAVSRYKMQGKPIQETNYGAITA